MNIAVIGTGYVGLVTGGTLAELGHHVICADTDGSKVDALKRGQLPIYEPGLDELIFKNARATRLKFTQSVQEAVSGARAIFLAVGTPSRDDGAADLSQVLDAAREVGDALGQDAVVIVKSTVPPGTGDQIDNILSEVVKPGIAWNVVANPEFLSQGTAVRDSLHPSRVVIGAADEEAARTVELIFQPLGARTLLTDRRSAEMIKYAANAFLALRISFINEIANLCELAGADVEVVAQGIGMDHRIGNQYLKAGAGFGGSCLPKDLRALIAHARSLGYEPELFPAALRLNVGRRAALLRKLEVALGSLNGKAIAVLGLAFKPGTDDLREAPAVDLIKEMLQRGAKVAAYDPVAVAKAMPILPEVTFSDEILETFEGCDAAVILTDWPEFKDLDFGRVKARLKRPILVDGRNLYDPVKMRDAGMIYLPTGRRGGLPYSE